MPKPDMPVTFTCPHSTNSVGDPHSAGAAYWPLIGYEGWIPAGWRGVWGGGGARSLQRSHWDVKFFKIKQYTNTFPNT